MPQLAFKKDNVRESGAKFPKIKLKKDEKARIIAIEAAPNVEFVHTLRKPKIVNGKPKEIVKYTKDQKPYTDYEYDFIATYICHGDLGTLMADAEDPDSCPMCKLAKESDIVERARRRFSMHIMKYATKTNSSAISTPFRVETLVWAFTDKVFTTLVELADEWGDLTKQDIILTCTNEVYQNYDISIAPKAEWLADEERTQIVRTTYEENQASDLSEFAGRRADLKYVNRDLDAVREAWDIATGNVSAPEFAGGDFDSSLEGLLDGQTVTDDGQVTQSEFPESFPDEDEPKKTSKKSEPDDFDSLLADLD